MSLHLNFEQTSSDSTGSIKFDQTEIDENFVIFLMFFGPILEEVSGFFHQSYEG